MTTDRQGVGARPDLQGWKEIAAYLGKSVRAAQRWERELGLPVHRLRTAAGQSIFARPDEIDEWRARQEITPDAGPPAPASTDGQRRASVYRLRAPAIAAAITLVVLAAAWSRWTRAQTPAHLTFELTDSAFIATDGTREVWRKSFDHTLEPMRPNAPGLAAAPMEGRVRSVDLDGDGEEEVIVAVPFKPDDDAALSDEVYCFSRSGQVRWTYKPDVSLRFRAGEYTGPWRISAMEIVPGPSAAVYVALAHRTWWPAPMMRIDSSGRAALQFVQSGHIYTMKVWRAGGKPLIAAGGINNEYASASVALLFPGDPPSHSPQSEGAPFECLGCPAGLPVGYFVFARTELNRASDFPYNRVASFAPADGHLTVHVQEDADINHATTMYEISPNFALLSGAPSDGYWLGHQRRQQPGRIDHDVHACQEMTLAARTFSPASGWTTTRLPFRTTAPGSH